METGNPSGATTWLGATVWGPTYLAPDPPGPELPEAVLVGRIKIPVLYMPDAAVEYWFGEGDPAQVVYEPGQEFPSLLSVNITMVNEMQIEDGVSNGNVLQSALQVSLLCNDVNQTDLYSITVPDFNTPAKPDVPSRVELLEYDTNWNVLAYGNLYYGNKSLTDVRESFEVEAEIWKFPDNKLEKVPSNTRELALVKGDWDKNTDPNITYSFQALGMRGFFFDNGEWVRKPGEPNEIITPIDISLATLQLQEMVQGANTRYTYILQAVAGSLIKPIGYYPIAYRAEILINGERLEEALTNITPQTIISFTEAVPTGSPPPTNYTRIKEMVLAAETLSVQLETVVEP